MHQRGAACSIRTRTTVDESTMASATVLRVSSATIVLILQGRLEDIGSMSVLRPHTLDDFATTVLVNGPNILHFDLHRLVAVLVFEFTFKLYALADLSLLLDMLTIQLIFDLLNLGVALQ
jgi:hypothetical protein